MSFHHLGLRSELTEAVTAKGYQTPSPIQAKAIPAVLEGRDVLAGAQTGTGKTAAFSLPLLQRLAAGNNRSRLARALVLTPTRELAAQVHQSVLDYGRGLKLRSTVLFGGVGYQPQIDSLRRGLDIIVATPGRLLDLSARRDVDLSSVEVLVLDEADRMLDMGFIHDIRRILKLIPQRRQTLFFSATYAPEVKQLADSILRDPVQIEVTPRNSTAEGVDQEAFQVEKSAKRSVLSAMIATGDWSQTLVFTRTKHGANRLAEQLGKDGISSMAIHGNKSQGARQRALSAFKDNRIRVLVATDIAARGLDIQALPYVVNYELPNVPEDYVHRIGRTGRAGRQGKAISLVSNEEHEYFTAIERLLKKEIPLFAINGQGESIPAERRHIRPRAGGPPARTGRAGNSASGSARGGNRGRRRFHQRRGNENGSQPTASRTSGRTEQSTATHTARPSRPPRRRNR